MARSGIPSHGLSYAALCSGVYAAFGVAWITLSDRVAEALIPESARLSLFQTYKGWVFVFGSALLIYFLLRGVERSRAAARALQGAGAPASPGFPMLMQLVLLVLAVAAPLCGLLAWSIYRSAEAEVDNAKRLVEDLARITARDTAKFVGATGQTLTAMAQRPLVRALDPAHCDPMLADAPVINPSYVNALTFDAAGALVCSVLPIPAGTVLRYPGSARHRQVLKEGAFAISQPLEGGLSGRPIVVASMPVRDARGAIAGSVNLSVDLESLRPVVRPVLPKSGVVALVDSTGVLIQGENPARRGKDARDTESVRLAIGKGSGEGLATGFDGIQRSYYFVPVEGIDWIAIAGVPTSTIYGQARANAWRGGVLGLGIILLAALVGTWISRRIAGPILSIAEAARRVAEGDVTVRAPQGGSREVGMVAQQFNRMLDQLPLIEGELRESEQRYKSLFETSPECIFVHAEGRIVMMNPAGARLYGAATAEQMVGMHVLDLAHPDHRTVVGERLREVTVERREVGARELKNLRLDGTPIFVEVRSTPFEFRGRPAVLTQLRDITARRAAEARVGRLSNLYAALSRSNAAMANERDRTGLCRAVCRIVVEEGKFITAGIRMHDKALDAYVPAASYGPVADWIGERTIAAGEKGSRMVRAIDSRSTYVLNDVYANPDGEFGQDSMRALGIRSMAVLPLLVGGEGVGGLSVFAGETGVFDAELIELLEEMARNLTFAFVKLDAEQALRDSEARYRALVEAAPDAIAVLVGGYIEMVNGAAMRLYGADRPDQLIGRRGLDMTHPDFHPEVAKALGQLARDGRPMRAEVKHLRLDGSVFDAEVVRSHFRYRGEDALQIIVRDISERKETERRILRLSRLYATLSRTNAAIARAVDQQSLCETVCRIAVEQGGLVTAFIGMLNPARDAAMPVGAYGQVAGLLGAVPVSLVQGAPAAGGPLAQALREGRTVVSNDLLADPRALAAKDDVRRTGIRAVAACPLWIDAEVAGALTVYADEVGFFDAELLGLLQEMAQNLSFGLSKLRGDAAHRASEAALRDSEARYRRLFNTTPVCIYVRQDDRVVLINPAGVDLFGASSADQIIGRLVTDLVPAEYHELMQRRLDFVNTEGRAVPAAEFRNVRLDGTVIDTESIVTPFEFQGRPAVQIIVSDISERKAAERAMRRLNAELEQRVQQRTGELQKVNQELSEFSYIVSHDLKAPLRGIASLVGWLEQDHGEKLGTEGRELLRLMSARSRRMHRLIEDILHFSRLGRAREASGEVNLARLVHEVIDSLEVPAHIEVRLAPLPRVRGDETRLRQVFQNLLSNAIKFMDRKTGGLIEISADAREEAGPTGAADPRAHALDESAHPEAPGVSRQVPVWLFQVADNGPGIEPRHHQRIFDIFQTLNPRDDPDSTGIGLTVVKKIIELMGGRIWVESDAGRGARFLFTLPRRELVDDAARPGGEAHEGPSTDTPGRR